MKAAPSLGDQVAELVAAMRAGGVGKMRLGELELDLTVAPVPLAAEAPVVDPDAERERAARLHERIAFPHGRTKLPWHGVTRRAG